MNKDSYFKESNNFADSYGWAEDPVSSSAVYCESDQTKDLKHEQLLIEMREILNDVNS